jgi:hypothetical protein
MGFMYTLVKMKMFEKKKEKEKERKKKKSIYRKEKKNH